MTECSMADCERARVATLASKQDGAPLVSFCKEHYDEWKVMLARKARKLKEAEEHGEDG